MSSRMINTSAKNVVLYIMTFAQKIETLNTKILAKFFSSKDKCLWLDINLKCFITHLADTKRRRIEFCTLRKNVTLTGAVNSYIIIWCYGKNFNREFCFANNVHFRTFSRRLIFLLLLFFRENYMVQIEFQCRF